MDIKVIGWHSPKVQRTLMNAQAAAAEFPKKPNVLWVQDVRQIIGMGKVLMPTVLVNEKVKATGRIPSVYELATWIEEESGEEMAA